MFLWGPDVSIEVVNNYYYWGDLISSERGCSNYYIYGKTTCWVKGKLYDAMYKHQCYVVVQHKLGMRMTLKKLEEWS